jgi:hypothetical protein
MSKSIAFFLSLLLIPVLALGQSACPTLSDQEYIDFLADQPATVQVDQFDDFPVKNFSGVATITFHRDGKLTEHVQFSCKQGSGTVDIVADWSVVNAVLSIHLVSTTHSDTGNKKLNDLLDTMFKVMWTEPDASAPLNYCDNFKRSLNGISFLNKTKLIH